jgi:hypothetical protein
MRGHSQWRPSRLCDIMPSSYRHVDLSSIEGPAMTTRMTCAATCLVLTAACAGALAAAPGATPAAPAPAAAAQPAGKYKSFAVTAYCVIGSLGGGRGGRGGAAAGGGPDLAQLENTWNTISSQIKIDKVYIETVRDQNEMPEAYIEPLKKFFLDRGVRVAGGMTLAQNNSGQFVTYNYSGAEDRATVKRLTEMTAKHFDEIILDDFFFYNTKTDADIAAKGDRSWTQYRVETMQDVSKNFVVGPAHAVNPKVKMVIKYPNWYEHFQANGYDLDLEAKTFDGIYTGTETRDPVRTEQHLQPYQSYQIVRYFENIKPGGNGGGWVDTGQYNVVDRYAEQLWDTAFAKSPEIMLFSWGNLMGPMQAGNRPWAEQKTSFNWDEMMVGAATAPAASAPSTAAGGGGGGRGFGGGFGGFGGGSGATNARVASYALNQVDKVVYKLGKPIGIKSYRPPHGTGEDFLHNFLGMAGLPIDLYPTYPADAPLVLLTADARGDKDLVKKIKASLVAGHNVVITSGLLKALGKEIQDIVEIEYTGNHIPVTGFHVVSGNPLAGGDLAKPILIPELQFITNDAWYVLAGMANGNGYPILISDKYSKGTLYVLTIPDAFTDLYNLPPAALSIIRNTLSQGLPVALTGNTPAYVSLFEYDNNTFIVQNFADEEKTVSVGVTGAQTLRNLMTDEVINPAAPGGAGGGRGGFGGGGGGGFGGGMGRGGGGRTTFAMTVKPHSWMAFSAGS